jgi:hypothetical protein
VKSFEPILYYGDCIVSRHVQIIGLHNTEMVSTITILYKVSLFAKVSSDEMSVNLFVIGANSSKPNTSHGWNNENILFS